MPKTALVLYGVLLSLYSIMTLYLFDQSSRFVQDWSQFQSFWIRWCVVSFFILIWGWYMLRPDTNPVKQVSLKWGERYARFCERLGPGIVAFWGVGVGYTWWLYPQEQSYLVLLGLAGFSLVMQRLELSRFAKLLWMQLSLPMALFILVVHSWQWLQRLSPCPNFWFHYTP